MSIAFASPAEAFMATAVVVLSADGMGSLAERKYLIDNVRTMPVFQGASVDEFDALCSDITDKVYGGLPTAETGLAPEGVTMLVAAVRAALSPDQRQEALSMASGLCDADGASGAEQMLLQQLKQGFMA